MIALHTAIAIVAIIFLIIKVKVDPIIALVLGALYLGLAGFLAVMCHELHAQLPRAF